jgi:hypothetical protein
MRIEPGKVVPYRPPTGPPCETGGWTFTILINGNEFEARTGPGRRGMPDRRQLKYNHAATAKSAMRTYVRAFQFDLENHCPS